jgi:hypothetical protein
MLHCLGKGEGNVWKYGCFCFSETMKRPTDDLMFEHLPCVSKQINCKIETEGFKL